LNLIFISPYLYLYIFKKSSTREGYRWKSCWFWQFYLEW